MSHDPTSVAGTIGPMRIALVTEEFSGSTAGASLTREVVARLIDAGHDVCVFAGGRGQATFRGARVFWASRMTQSSTACGDTIMRSASSSMTTSR